MQPKTTSNEVASVLLIEECSTKSQIYLRELRSANYRCYAADKATEALSCLQSHHPDIVILDMALASKNSPDFIHELRAKADQNWLPVVALLNHAGDAQSIQALKAGANSYLVEPVSPDLLVATVRSYQQALALRAQAAQRAQLKDEFLAMVSHELRTPITSVVGAMALLVSEKLGPLPPKALELANIAKKNGDRLTRLIDDVLDLAKLESDRMEVHLQLCDLRPLLATSVEAIAYYEQRLEVSVELEPCPDSAMCWVDSNRFLQVMGNLLSNAIKHSPRGKVVSLRLVDANGDWCVEVQDQGPGIDPALKANLFTRFSQAPKTERRHAGGTGLGLYISRMLVERMGGRIGATSLDGQGSVFSITLPKGTHHA